jgi:hypothetical protein
MSAAIGHNNPPAFDFFEFFDRVVNTLGMTSAEKLAQIVIARQSHANGGKAVAPARAEIARQASCSEATLKRSYRLLETFFEVNKRAGRTTEYTPKASVTTDQVEAAISGMKPAKGAHSEPGPPRAGAHQVQDSVSRGAPSEGHGEPGPAKVPPHPPKNNNIYNNPPTPHSGKPRGGRGAFADPFGLNPHMAKERGDVWFDDDDRLQVCNGFKSEMQELVGDEGQLRIELDRAAEWIGLFTPAHLLKAKVRGRVQSQVSERKDRDRRYERAKDQNAKTAPKGKFRTADEREKSANDAWFDREVAAAEKEGLL